MASRVYNPTDKVIKPMNYLDEKSWKGIRPGETLVVGSKLDVLRLTRAGCIEI